MCGIFCYITKCAEESAVTLKNKFTEFFEESLSRRGPDSLRTIIHTHPEHNTHVLYASSVLWLQGPKITVQPITDEDGNVFCYNGDVFGGYPDGALDAGDTLPFFERLKTSKNIREALKTIQGPYAFIFYEAATQRVYFARDNYGRRSLLVGINDKNEFIVTSVAKRGSGFKFIELPSNGCVYSVNLTESLIEMAPIWESTTLKLNVELSTLNVLRNVENYNKINWEEFKEPDEEDLALFNELIQNGGDDDGNIFTRLMENVKWRQTTLLLQQKLEISLKKRIDTQPDFCQDCHMNPENCSHAPIGVLFSGGVDCAILALISDKFIKKQHSIDLINVSFEKNGTYASPDRLSALKTCAVLSELRPARRWRFVPVDVSQDALNAYRSGIIADLVYPLRTVLDESLGCALWFASRARNEAVAKVTSQCRTLLIGSGADELFGGYTRHRNAFKRHGWRGLHDTLLHDLRMLPYRNLGRDDRVCADHGRQLRTPYLDEDVVDFVGGLAGWQKTWPTSVALKPDGVGGKVLLRSVGHVLGLGGVAGFKKKALQFGSNIANAKERGNDVSAKLSKGFENDYIE